MHRLVVRRGLDKRHAHRRFVASATVSRDAAVVPKICHDPPSNNSLSERTESFVGLGIAYYQHNLYTVHAGGFPNRQTTGNCPCAEKFRGATKFGNIGQFNSLLSRTVVQFGRVVRVVLIFSRLRMSKFVPDSDTHSHNA